MIVLYDHQIFSLQQYGGVSRYFFELASRIPVVSQDESEIFAPFHANKYLASGSSLFSSQIVLGKFRGVTVLTNSVNTLLGKLLIKKRSDIAIFHETYYKKQNYAPPTAKTIITIHDMIPELYPELFVKDDEIIRAKRLAIDRADHIICVSHNTRRDLHRLFEIDPSKTSVIHLGVTPPFRSVEVGASKYGRDKPYLLYVGQRSNYKNYAALLRAYGQTKLLKDNFSLVMFGGGPPKEQELRALQSLRIPETNVLFTGGSDTALSQWYSHAAAFVYPSLYEGFGIPPLEAMAHGCAVVCSNTSSLPEVTGDAAELFDPTDSDALANAIIRVVESRQRTEELISRGFRRVENFSWNDCARATLDQYLQCVNE